MRDQKLTNELIHFYNHAHQEFKGFLGFNSWYYGDFSRAYVRYERRMFRHRYEKCFTLASISIDELYQNKNIFTNLIEDLRKLSTIPFVVENAHSKIVQSVLVRKFNAETNIFYDDDLCYLIPTKND